MAKSDLTLAELHAAAKLLGDGWYYDWVDHTFNYDPEGAFVTIFCADTMEQIKSVERFPTYDARRQQVKAGLLGAKDLKRNDEGSEG